MRVSRKEFFGVIAKGVAGSALLQATVARAAGAVRVPDTKPKKLEGAAIKGATNAVKRFITTTNRKNIPPDVIQQATRCVIDAIGVILAGSTVRRSALSRASRKSVADKK